MSNDVSSPQETTSISFLPVSDMQIEGKRFVISLSKAENVSELRAYIRKHSGAVSRTVTSKVDYLLLPRNTTDKNEDYAQFLELRRAGHSIEVICAEDFCIYAGIELLGDQEKKTRKGYILDIPDQIVTSGKHFWISGMNKNDRKKLIEHIEKHQGVIDPAFSARTDYLLFDADHESALESCRKARQLRGQYGISRIVSIADFFRLANAGDTTVASDSDLSVELPMHDDHGYTVDTLHALPLKDKSILFVGFSRKELQFLKPIASQKGATVQSKLSFPLDYAVINTESSVIPPEYADILFLRQTPATFKLHSVEDFCEQTGLKLKPEPIKDEDLPADAREARRRLFQYYGEQAKSDGSAYWMLSRLRTMSPVDLLTLAEERHVYSAPITPNPEGGPYIIVSYDPANEPTAKSIIRQLQSDGFRVWAISVAEDGSITGQEDIVQSISGSAVFIALLSPEYLDSELRKGELTAAKDENKPVLLVYIEDCTLPGGLRLRFSRAHAMFFRQMITTDFYEKLYSMEELIPTCSREIPQPVSAPLPPVQEISAEASPADNESLSAPVSASDFAASEVTVSGTLSDRPADNVYLDDTPAEPIVLGSVPASPSEPDYSALPADLSEDRWKQIQELQDLIRAEEQRTRELAESFSRVSQHFQASIKATTIQIAELSERLNTILGK